MSSYVIPNLLVPSPFRQLAALIGETEPGAEPIDMSIGAPQHALPAFVAEEIGKDLEPLSHYPAITGRPEFRLAVSGWLGNRYGIADLIGNDNVLPVNGSREGLFYAAFLAKDIAARNDPCVIVPNPCYPTYIGAAKAAGCRVVTLPETADGLGAPDALPVADLEAAVAVYFHSPTNPQGAVASAELWQSWIEAARRHGFFLFADECYSEIYRDIPPVGVLESAAKTGGADPFERIVTFNSLSKRSNMPGVRAGFVAGDAGFLAAFAAFRNVSGPQMPVPVQNVAIRALSDEAHVAENRALYNAKFELAREALDVSPPAGGFFLWLDVTAAGGGEAAAKRLWTEAGIKTVPGKYLTYSAPGAGGEPSDRFLRLALVSADLDTTKTALTRVAAVLGGANERHSS